MKKTSIITFFIFLFYNFATYAQFGNLKDKVKKETKTTAPVTNDPAKSVSESKVVQQTLPKQAVWPEGNINRIKPAAFFIPMHEKNVGKIIFSKQKLKPDVTNESMLSNTFNVGEPIFGRVFTKEPLKNYCLYSEDNGNGPWENVYCEGYAYFYFNESKKPNASIKYNHKGGGSDDWTTWQMFINANGEDAKFNKESVINAVNDLPIGTHKVRVEIVAGNAGRYAIEPAASGEFTLVKAQGAKLKLGASWADYKSKMTNATLEKQILTVVSDYAAKNGWKENFTKIKILDADWIEIKNEYTGIPINRVLNLMAYAKWPDGHCTAQEFSVSQEYVLGTGAFSKTITFGGIGNQDKIDCE